MADRLKSFKEFWPHYLQEHRLAKTRRIHFWGTSTAVALIVLALSTQRPWILLVAAVAGYGPAWYSHFFVEKNRPATFTYPIWSLAADFRLWWLTLTKRKID